MAKCVSKIFVVDSSLNTILIANVWLFTNGQVSGAYHDCLATQEHNASSMTLGSGCSRGAATIRSEHADPNRGGD